MSNLLNFELNGQRQGLKVTPKDSVEDKQIYDNAVENLALISKEYWLQKSKMNDEVAWMASAGPELERLLKLGYINHEIFRKSGNILFCVKHSLPTLLKYNYVPHFCIALDPRPIDGISTHGKLRSSLYGSAPKSVKFLIASMTHPSVTKFLLSQGYQVFGWHSAAAGLIDKGKGAKIPEIKHFITGGTCSATRCIGMAHFMGFRKINLVGIDSNLSEEPQNQDELDPSTNTKKYWKVRIGNSREFWTTGELIAQIQDLEMFLSNELSDIEISILGADKESSLAGALNEAIVNKTKTQSTYQQQVGPWKI